MTTTYSHASRRRALTTSARPEERMIYNKEQGANTTSRARATLRAITTWTRLVFSTLHQEALVLGREWNIQPAGRHNTHPSSYNHTKYDRRGALAL